MDHFHCFVLDERDLKNTCRLFYSSPPPFPITNACLPKRTRACIASPMEPKSKKGAASERPCDWPACQLCPAAVRCFPLCDLFQTPPFPFFSPRLDSFSMRPLSSAAASHLHQINDTKRHFYFLMACKCGCNRLDRICIGPVHQGPYRRYPSA